MHCPYLEHSDNSCHVVKPQYKPSEFEVDEYCATEKHLHCPLYHKHILKAINMFIKTKPVSDAELIRMK
jgi:hypothetical protein